VDLPRYDVLSELNKITCPVLMVAGRHDPICPPEFSQVLDDSLPNSKTVVFEDSGHWPFIEEEEKFIEIVFDFLEGM
jgi:proline iminopeptidase